MKGQMNTRQLTQVVLGGVAGVSLLIAFILLLDRGDGVSSAAVASPLGWAFPLGSLLAIVGVTWFVLSRTPKDPGSDESVYAPCGNCGRSVLRDWRLCPYCGAMLERTQDGRVSEGR